MNFSSFELSDLSPPIVIECNLFDQCVVSRRLPGRETEVALNWLELEPLARAHVASLGQAGVYAAFACPGDLAAKARWGSGGVA